MDLCWSSAGIQSNREVWESMRFPKNIWRWTYETALLKPKCKEQREQEAKIMV